MYIKTNWVDQNVENPKTYRFSQLENGSNQLIEAFGEVVELGTPVNAENMNHIEEGIANNDQRIEDLEAKTQGVLNQTQITNCLLEVPQRIKYKIEDGVLTLLAGSVFVVPYGTEDLSETYPVGDMFEESETLKVADTQYGDGKFFLWLEAAQDISRSLTGTAEYFLQLGISTENISWYQVSNSASNTTTIPSAGQIYNTDTNYSSAYNSSTFAGYLSFPFMRVTLNNGLVTAVKEVYNGMGYIGTHFWADKGIKGLIPNGRNNDGSLKNIEFTTSSIMVNSSSGNDNYYILIDENNLQERKIASERYYDDKNNFFMVDGARFQGCVAGIASKNSGTITSLKMKSVFHAVDYSDFADKAYLQTKYQSGNSGYVIWSNKFCIQWGRVGAGTSTSVTFLKEMANTNYHVSGNLVHSYIYQAGYEWFAESIKTTGFTLKSTDSLAKSWVVIGTVK